MGLESPITWANHSLEAILPTSLVFWSFDAYEKLTEGSVDLEVDFIIIDVGNFLLTKNKMMRFSVTKITNWKSPEVYFTRL